MDIKTKILKYNGLAFSTEELVEEIQKNIGDYIFDVNFRVESKVELLKEIYDMSEIQFNTVKYLIQNKEWDYFNFVIIGLDRFHHAFWKY